MLEEMGPVGPEPEQGLAAKFSPQCFRPHAVRQLAFLKVIEFDWLACHHQANCLGLQTRKLLAKRSYEKGVRQN